MSTPMQTAPVDGKAAAVAVAVAVPFPVQEQRLPHPTTSLTPEPELGGSNPADAAVRAAPAPSALAPSVAGTASGSTKDEGHTSAMASKPAPPLSDSTSASGVTATSGLTESEGREHDTTARGASNAEPAPPLSDAMNGQDRALAASASGSTESEGRDHDAAARDSGSAMDMEAAPAPPLSDMTSGKAPAPAASPSVAAVQAAPATARRESGRVTGSDADAALATANKLTGVSEAGVAAAPPSTAGNVGDGGGGKHHNSASDSAAAAPASKFSMTLAIGPEDTRRVFAASRAFHAELRRLQNTQRPIKRRVPELVHSPQQRAEQLWTPAALNPATVGTLPPSPAAAVTGPAAARPRPLRELLIPAAAAAADPLLSALLRRLAAQGKTPAEVQTGLLFFLDDDKSTKLLMAFDVFGRAEEEGGDAAGAGAANENISRVVSRGRLIQLFQAFLTSISTCVHGEGPPPPGGGGGGAAGDRMAEDGGSAAPPPGEDKERNTATRGVVADWTGSERTRREILEVATFATDNLVTFAAKECRDRAASAAAGARKEPPANSAERGEAEKGASFDSFGAWYNSGGFSLVPWLELLDLSKWDYTNAAADKTMPNPAPLSSASKRARLRGRDGAPAEETTPCVAAMAEPIGSPTALFARGALLGATPPPPPAAKARGMIAGAGPGEDGSARGEDPCRARSFAAMFGADECAARAVVSFDFSGSTPPSTDGDSPSAAFHIDITEENLIMLRDLVRRTGLAELAPRDVEALMMKHARVERHQYGETTYVISRAQFGKFIREVVPKASSKKFAPAELENFSNYFTNFFTCFDYSWSALKKDEVNAKELLVGFSFLFAGNKSSKLAAAYDVLDADRCGYLTQRGLLSYLRSYLTMLAGISLLSASKCTTTEIRQQLLLPDRREKAFQAVENGAKWTLSHFLRAFERECRENRETRNSTRSNAVTFEDFAHWYTEGGYAVAPWLELLDLNKFLSLIGEGAGSLGDKVPGSAAEEAERRRLSEVLFTFPLAKERSLVVLRDDAHYVRSVVNKLGLLSLTSEDIWSVLFNDVAKSVPVAAKEGYGTAVAAAAAALRPAKRSKQIEVDQATFVQCMMRILSGTGNLKSHPSDWADFSPEDTLRNFYLSFDLAQSKRVALNQLMCGLTLLCGGKKSNKLVFAFSLFSSDDAEKNAKKKASLNRDDFFYFFRSFLIVMFSCCNQSLSLSADAVTQYISDTAGEVADNVMGYWKAKNVEHVRFENFSEWYNEGGFETAPWLELLDLQKWVLADQEQPPAPATGTVCMTDQGMTNKAHQQRQQTPQPQQLCPLPTESRQQTPPPQQLPQQAPQPPITPAPINPAASSHTPGLTPGHEAIKALLASPRMDVSGSSPGCPPAPTDEDFLDLDMSAVDAEVDDMDFILQHEPANASQSHVENVSSAGPVAAVKNRADGQSEAAEPMAELSDVLKFNLLTHDPFGGYTIFIGPKQVQFLHRIVSQTGLSQIDAPTVCKFILFDSKERRQATLSKKAFQSTMKRVFTHTFRSMTAPVSASTREELASFTERLFASFDRPPLSSSKLGRINTPELACGFTVLCAGRKSDKLEHIFELLDEDKDTLVSRQDIARFVRSFLAVLMSVSSSFTHLHGKECKNDVAAIAGAISAGAEWATSQVFEGLQQTIPSKNNSLTEICFDDFADWYTKGGYENMPWLELLDLNKWLI